MHVTDCIIRDDTPGWEFTPGLAMVPDGSAVTIVAGLDIDGLTFMGFFRYNDDGSPDTSFSNDGQAIVSDPLGGFASAMQIDGRILLIDYAYRLARFAPDPTEGFKLDSSFGDSGVVTIDSPEGEAAGLAVGLDGQVVAVGSANVSGTTRVSLVDYNGTVRQYVQQDANFNVTSLTDAEGTVTERYLYDPYGAVTVLDADWDEDADNTSDQGQVYLFQGGRLDGMSLYLAMRGNPVACVDPMGLVGSTGGNFPGWNAPRNDPPSKPTPSGSTPGQPTPSYRPYDPGISIWDDGIVDGFQAWLDGLIPIWDPLSDHYNTDRSDLQWSKVGGQVSLYAWLAALGLKAGKFNAKLELHAPHGGGPHQYWHFQGMWWRPGIKGSHHIVRWP